MTAPLLWLFVALPDGANQPIPSLQIGLASDGNQGPHHSQRPPNYDPDAPCDDRCIRWPDDCDKALCQGCKTCNSTSTKAAPAMS